MTCEKCDLEILGPGAIIKVDSINSGRCLSCGEKVIIGKVKNTLNWDEYYHNICKSVSSKSSCLSRKIGAILVRNNSVISTGYNGPARGIPHCGVSRLKADFNLGHELTLSEVLDENICPRRILGYQSCEGMEWCPAQHAEENCVSNAARLGVSTIGSTLYMNSVIPCKNCFSTLINAGIFQIVVESNTLYDRYSKFIIDNSNITIRTFNYDS